MKFLGFKGNDDLDGNIIPILPSGYQCLTCGKKLSNKFGAQRHYMTAHIEKIPVPCRFCETTCKNSFSYEKHVRDVHGITKTELKKMPEFK